MFFLLVTNEVILKNLGRKIKRARAALNYTQEYVAENTGISTDLLRNIENGRNIGSIATLINLCNLLKVTPNDLFYDVLENRDITLDPQLYNLLNNISKKDHEYLKQIIIHIDKHY